MVFLLCLLIVVALWVNIVLWRNFQSYGVYSRRCESILTDSSISEELLRLEQGHREIETKLEKGQKFQFQLSVMLEARRADAERIKVGLIPATFDLGDSEMLKAAIFNCRHHQYECITGGGATEALTGWTLKGSQSLGEQMVKDYRLLLLKAFNDGFEVIRKQMRTKSYKAAEDKLHQLGEQLERLSETTGVCISQKYIDLKIDELKWWHDEILRRDRLKTQRKEEQLKLRKQRRLSKYDTDKLDEELTARESELKKAQRKARELVGAERIHLELLIKDIKKEKCRLEEKFERAVSQAQLTKMGYIYVISNHGCFGEGVVKIGMTRRLVPMDRVIELGDASVPFRFDVHTLAFVDNAPKLEKSLHNLFSERRVNTENLRKEFFEVSPQEVKLAMDLMGIKSDWYFDVEAKEFRESLLIRAAQKEELRKNEVTQNIPESV